MNTNRKGFTLVEIMVTLVVFTIVVASVLTIYMNSQRTAQRVDLMTQAQQAARNAQDYIIKDLRSAGYSIDLEESATTAPQRAIVYAAPYEVIINANIKPANDTPDNPLSPAAIKPGPSSPHPAHYTPSREFTTGAETIVYTLDYNNDGSINSTDRNFTEAAFTSNPDDYALVKRVYGYDPSSGSPFDNTNQVVSIVAGPEHGQPMFKYYYDHDGDATTPDALWGDSDGDDELSASEIASLTPMTSQEIMDKIKRMEVTITGISSEQYNGEYLTSEVSTQVNVTRNSQVEVYYITGHVYEDANVDSTYQTTESGINDIKVRLSTGEMTYTQSLGTDDGLWHFAVIPGNYTVTISPGVGYRPTTETSFDFSVVDTSIDFTESGSAFVDFFGLEAQPTANVMGFVFNDNNNNNYFDTDGTEETLDNIEISCYNNETYTAYNDSIHGYTYDLEVNAEETLFVWMSNKDSIGADGPTDSLQHVGAISTTGSYFDSISPDAFKAYVPEAGTLYAAFAATYATGTPCSVQIIDPNGGEVIDAGDTYPVSIYADSRDVGENIKYVKYHYSHDGGRTWQLIEQLVYPPDPTSYSWDIDSTITPSDFALLGVEITDEGGWTRYDVSDDYFSIVSEYGYRQLYFTRAEVDTIQDDTLYQYTSSGSGVFPVRYMKTRLDTVSGSVRDSLDNKSAGPGQGGTWTYPSAPDRQMWNLYHNNQDWITEKNFPRTDTIWDGTWTFEFYGSHNNMDSSTAVYYDIGVFVRDSTGLPDTEDTLFTTLPGYHDIDSIIKRDTIRNFERKNILKVFVPDTFSIDKTDRLVFRVYWSGNATHTGSDEATYVYFLFDDNKPSKALLPAH